MEAVSAPDTFFALYNRHNIVFKERRNNETPPFWVVSLYVIDYAEASHFI